MVAERVSAEAAVCASIYLMGFGLEVMRELRYERYEEKYWHLVMRSVHTAVVSGQAEDMFLEDMFFPVKFRD